ncbi:hypothetical protein Fcan01_25738 [Folsomia candida]|uniref:Gustatory receptor n=1 Tax=Folsomia candida TaxID=158441 RepID=A0A226D382_FOLCA|nr:hypothetical protein Fcan01_25738 [Folsomia candida]
MFLVVDTISGGVVSYTFLQIVRSSSKKPYTSLPSSLILGFLGVSLYYAIVNHVMVTVYGKDAVNGFNEIVKIERQLVATTLEEAGTTRPVIDDSHAKLASILTMIVQSFSAYRYIIAPSQFFMQFDAYYFTLRDLNDIFKFSQSTMLVFNLARLGILTITVFEIFRLLCLVILIFISALNMVRSIFAVLLHVSGQRFTSLARINAGITTQFKMQLAMKALAPFQELGTFFLILIGLVIFVVSNFVTIKLYDSLPFPVYAFFSSVSVVVALVINLTLPLAHGLLDSSTEIKRRLGASLMGEGNKRQIQCGRRRLNGMQLFCVWAGFGGNRMFRLNKETKVQYFEQVISATVNILLGN